MDHHTGAVRSSDADHVAYSLVSPIGLQKVALAAAQCYNDYRNLTALRHLSYSINFQYRYLSGDRSHPFLALASWHGMATVDKLHNHFLPQIDIVDSDIPHYELIPPYGWQSIAEAYAEGAVKYSAYNCEKGFPICDLLNHSLNHQALHLMGDTTEPHLGHANWGILMSIHSEVLWPQLNEHTLRQPGCLPPKQNESPNFKKYLETSSTRI